MDFFSVHTLKRRKGMARMEKKQDQLWQKFRRTGQVGDYLRYCGAKKEERNPRERIMDSSRYKRFY